MKGIEKVEEVLGKITFSEFTFVHSLKFEFNGSDTEYGLEMVLRKEQCIPNPSLKLFFFDVRSLTLGKFGSHPTQIMGFDILDISSNGLEDIALEGLDYEDSLIHFYARQGRITLLTE